jgi:hypothetical protein
VSEQELTKDEIKAKLDELGVEYDESAKKAELQELLAEVEEPEEEGDDAGDDEEEAAEEEHQAGASDQNVSVWPSEVFPEKRPIDVDIAALKDKPLDEPDAEYLAPLNGESWVVLDGEHELVDDRYDGAVAMVLAAPTNHFEDEFTGAEHDYLPEGAQVTVKERGQGVTMVLPLEAFKEIHNHGRPDQFA